MPSHKAEEIFAPLFDELEAIERNPELDDKVARILASMMTKRSETSIDKEFMELQNPELEQKLRRMMTNVSETEAELAGHIVLKTKGHGHCNPNCPHRDEHEQPMQDIIRRHGPNYALKAPRGHLATHGTREKKMDYLMPEVEQTFHIPPQSPIDPVYKRRQAWGLFGPCIMRSRKLNSLLASQPDIVENIFTREPIIDIILEPEHVHLLKMDLRSGNIHLKAQAAEIIHRFLTVVVKTLHFSDGPPPPKNFLQTKLDYNEVVQVWKHDLTQKTLCVSDRAIAYAARTAIVIGADGNEVDLFISYADRIEAHVKYAILMLEALGDGRHRVSESNAAAKESVTTGEPTDQDYSEAEAAAGQLDLGLEKVGIYAFRFNPPGFPYEFPTGDKLSGHGLCWALPSSMWDRQAKRIDTLEMEKEACDKEKSEMIKRKDETIGKKESEIKKRDDALMKKNEMIKKNEEKLRRYQTDIKALNKRLNNAREEASSQRSSQAESAELRVFQVKAKKELKLLGDKNEKLQASLKEMERSDQAAKESIAALSSRVRELSAEKERLAEGRHQLEEENSSQRIQLEDLKAELEMVRDELRAQQSAPRQQEATKPVEQAVPDVRRNIVAENKELERSIRQLKDTMAARSERIRKKEKTLAKLNAEISAWENSQDSRQRSTRSGSNPWTSGGREPVLEEWGS
ncbi:hypothetical protein M011DRAFT_487541 [Sporormia fimetaria CBS 119925]|uniref:Uncharacterized protein n=1 Tax=Sporormia fimetaria CBS 119925 TaxID=1340428 RepID=A0A6A6V8F5_9PLEO|nr:hypothetical protein M011DRAFT_487541 [Sporormia fimetaria CBS 119925]